MVPVGAQLTRIYFAVRTASDYGAFRQYDNWDEAVTAAQAKHAEYVKSFTNSLGGLRSDIQELASRACFLETRWVMAWGRDADGIGGGMDFAHERHADVTVLRTQASFAPQPTRLPSADQVRNLTAKEAVGLARSMNEG